MLKKYYFWKTGNLLPMNQEGERTIPSNERKKMICHILNMTKIRTFKGVLSKEETRELLNDSTDIKLIDYYKSIKFKKKESRVQFNNCLG